MYTPKKDRVRLAMSCDQRSRHGASEESNPVGNKTHGTSKDELPRCRTKEKPSEQHEGFHVIREADKWCLSLSRSFVEQGSKTQTFAVS